MKKGIAIFGKCGIIKTIQKEVTRKDNNNDYQHRLYL